MKEIKTKEEVSPQEKSSIESGGEKVYRGARKCPECGSPQYVKRQSELEGVPAVICHKCGYKFSSAPSVEVNDLKKPTATKPEPEEIPSGITFDEVYKTLNDMDGVTVMGDDKYRGPRIKVGNKNLFSLLRRDKGVTIRHKNKEGKYSYTRYRIEKPENLKRWYDLAKEEAKKVGA